MNAPANPDPYRVHAAEEDFRACEALGYPRIHGVDDLDALPHRLGKGHEFAVASTFHPAFIEACVIRGIFPMSIRMGGCELMAPKLHEARCVLPLPGVHIGRRVRQKARGFAFSVDRAFDKVLALCQAQHGMNWLVPPLIAALRHIHRNPDRFRMAMHSFEVWEGDLLAGGEIGFSLGDLYTSMSGAWTVDSAGSVQLAITGTLLARWNFALWDLGMAMDYKQGLGARCIDRAAWQETVAKLGGGKARFRAAAGNCRECLETDGQRA